MSMHQTHLENAADAALEATRLAYSNAMWLIKNEDGPMQINADPKSVEVAFRNTMAALAGALEAVALVWIQYRFVAATARRPDELQPFSRHIRAWGMDPASRPLTVYEEVDRVLADARLRARQHAAKQAPAVFRGASLSLGPWVAPLESLVNPEEPAPTVGALSRRVDAVLVTVAADPPDAAMPIGTVTGASDGAIADRKDPIFSVRELKPIGFAPFFDGQPAPDGVEWVPVTDGQRQAAQSPDWLQVVLNGGPPCFQVENGKFCFRAERWDGHHTAKTGARHTFTSLADLLTSAVVPPSVGHTKAPPAEAPTKTGVQVEFSAVGGNVANWSEFLDVNPRDYLAICQAIKVAVNRAGVLQHRAFTVHYAGNTDYGWIEHRSETRTATLGRFRVWHHFGTPEAGL